MGGKGVVLLMGALIVAVCGCRSIDKVHINARQSQELAPEDAQKELAEGLTLYNQQPRSVETVTTAAHLLEQAAHTLQDDYDAQWQAAQALAFLAENESRPQDRRESAQHGIVFARRARELRPESVEGLYWYALNVGLLADVDRTYGLDAVNEMAAALKQAIDVDERYDMGGPLRVMGILYLRTPQPPASIGSTRKGLRLLQHAVDLFPEYPENYLYLAEALRDSGRLNESQEAIRKVLDAKPWPDRQFESEVWKARAIKLRDQPNKS